MQKAIGTKLRMSQIYKGDAALAVTPVSFDEKADLSWLKEGDRINVSGTSRGLGFQGGVKRWHFKGGPKTHGQKNRHRGPGSIGNTTPQRVLPGRHMAGHMGAVRATTKNVMVASIDADKKLVLLNGSVPGYAKGRVELWKKQ